MDELKDLEDDYLRSFLMATGVDPESLSVTIIDPYPEELIDQLLLQAFGEHN